MEVMGRDVSIVAAHPLLANEVLRAIIPSETKVNPKTKEICFRLKENKVFLFEKETGERIYVK